MKQKQKIVEALSNDCKIRFKYINDKGETCAIGCLAQLINFDLSEIQAEFCNGDYINSDRAAIVKLSQELLKELGLSLSELKHIQKLNDNPDDLDITKRRMAIINYINSLSVESI